MGRGKIEIKRIENTNNRQVTYSKRRNGLIKKAKEISVLCDAKVSLVIFASSGKMHEYCSPSSNLVDILDMYHQKSGKRLWDAKHENLSNEIDRIKKENDNMQIELRHLKGEDITSLNYRDLMALEEALDNGLAGLRDRKSEYVKMIKRNGKILEDQNEQLHLYLQQQEMSMEGNGGGGVGSSCYNQQQQQERERDYNPSMPFEFRLVPLQPNLQDRM